MDAFILDTIMAMSHAERVCLLEAALFLLCLVGGAPVAGQGSIRPGAKTLWMFEGTPRWSKQNAYVGVLHHFTLLYGCFVWYSGVIYRQWVNVWAAVWYQRCWPRTPTLGRVSVAVHARSHAMPCHPFAARSRNPHMLGVYIGNGLQHLPTAVLAGLSILPNGCDDCDRHADALPIPMVCHAMRHNVHALHHCHHCHHAYTPVLPTATTATTHTRLHYPLPPRRQLCH